jgi:hypothetical protein
LIADRHAQISVVVAVAALASAVSNGGADDQRTDTKDSRTDGVTCAITTMLAVGRVVRAIAVLISVRAVMATAPTVVIGLSRRGEDGDM